MINHDYNSTIKSFTADELTTVVEECVSALHKVLKSIDTIKALKNDEIDEFDALDVFELSMIENTGTFRSYAKCACSRYNPVNRCMRESCVMYSEEGTGLIDVYNQYLDQVVTPWAGLTEDEVAEIERVSKELAGQLSYVLRYEFSLDITLDSYNENNENPDLAEVDEVFKNYCLKNNLNLMDSVNEIINICKIYKPTLPIFDEYPELEELFDAKVGPYWSDVDPEQLTLQIVLGVVNGDINPIDLSKIMNAGEAE